MYANSAASDRVTPEVRYNDEDGFRLRRLGVIAEPTPGEPMEAWGILNPGAARGRHGQLYLFPRVIAEGNYSRIARARVVFDAAGRPAGIERLGYALEPHEPYEQNQKMGGGCEDARVTYLRPLDLYVMAYTAYTLLGPRIALAVSRDLLTWERLGLLRFAPTCPVDFNAYGNKDGLFFPEVLTDEQGRPSLALIHRPTYHVAQADGTVSMLVPPGVSDRRQSLWMSHVSVEQARRDPEALTWIEDTHLLAVPEQPWEGIKIGGGAPPALTPLGWVLVYHGVSGEYVEGDFRQDRLRYAVGVMVLDAPSGRRVLCRSVSPLLSPAVQEECEGNVPNVVFPTGIDQRPDADDPAGFDVYYGMADTRIGVARLHVPNKPPTEV
jgi:predicted GH43/DUF377 family glycosyl hydrolase